MLRELRIRDFAIIDDLALSFDAGLNVLTGETGAGKSIILQALGLLCGARGAADLIRSDADEASIEGLFDCSLPEELREGLGVTGDEIVVRRHLARNGKSRVYVNGSPATVAMLAQLGDHLVHIYGQLEQALLLRPASHLELLDRFAELGSARQRMAAAHAAHRDARARLAQLETARASLAEQRELLEFQHRELADAAVQSGEEVELRRERELLRHAERLQQVCRDGESMLYSGQAATVSALGRLAAQLNELGAIAPALAAAAELVDGGRVQLEEAALQLRAAADRLEADPDRLEGVESRLQLLSRLSRKHGLASDELPERLAALARDLAAIDSQSGDLASARTEVESSERTALAAAGELSTARGAAVRKLDKRMVGELSALGMRGATFRTAHQAPAADAAVDALGPTGFDTVEFLLAANPGEAPKPLARVASGGELSRIMLALKALTAAIGETPILIFDEVDAGIGGTVADAVARRLKTLARNRQLLCITHLPQIAAYGDSHYAVEKRQQGGRTVTHARALAADERIAEVSRMLGGSTANAEAERYARRLLAEAQRAP
jgi:DNA repair protein RecN (Recombination protein N)